MNEAFFQYLWKVGMFQPFLWQTEKEENIQIIDRGHQNHHAGPDFLNGKVLINEVEWHGHIEMHIKASEWVQHGHHKDPAYDNVILHVVLENDQKVYNTKGQSIPTIEIKDKIPAGFFSRYKNLQHSLKSIPCEKQLPNVEQIKLISWLDRMGIERLEQKASRIITVWNELNKDWEKTVFYLWCVYMGGKVNADAFKHLAAKIEIKHLWKNKPFIQQLEAYLLGLSGILHDGYKDVYPNLLWREFEHLRIKWNLQPMKGLEWRFFRMRPSNFPTLRFAQLAMIYHQQGRFFPWILHASPKELEKILKVKPSSYWQNHYLFDRPAKKVYSNVGTAQFEKLLINVVYPIRYAYAHIQQNENEKERVVSALQNINAENNKITRLWKKHGISSENAFQSQALIQLKKEWCDKKRCLDCALGNLFLSQQTFSDKVEESFLSWSFYE